MRRLSVLVLALCVTGACASSAARVASVTSVSTVPATSSTVPPPTTAAPAPTTTTAVPTTTTAPPPPASIAALPAVATTRTGVVVPVVARQGDGYLVKTPCDRTAAVTVLNPVGPVDVVLDAGHGGAEKGAIGPNGLTEATLNMAVIQQARAALQRDGLRVALTRTGEYMMALAPRAAVATALHPRAYVSVHHNSEPDGAHDGPGTETYYQIGSAGSKRLAGLIWEEVHNALAQYQVAWVADTDAGAKYRPGKSGGDYYAILRQAKGVTTSLAELAFISNPAEADLLARPDVQHVEGEAVARGIVRYLTTRDPGSGFTEPYPRTEPAGGGGGSTGCVDPPLE